MTHGGPTLEQVYPEELQPVEGPHAGAGEKHEEERVAKRSCYELTVIPAPHCSAGGRGVRSEREKLSLGSRVGKKVLV